MARSLRLAKAERDWLKSILAPTSMDWSALGGTKSVKLAASILAKVEESEERSPGVDARPIEDALLKASRGKVVRLEGEGGYGRASRQAGAVKATPELATLIGEWMARQGWLHGPMTVLDVLNKWYMWLPKARATEPPKGLPAGLGPAGAPIDRDDGPSPAPAGKATTGRRQAPGLR